MEYFEREETEDCGLEDCLNIIFIKNQLINAPLDKLKEINSGYEEFGEFIDTLNIALDAEPAFFLLSDEIIRRAEAVVAHKRFEYSDPQYNAIINNIIGQINCLKSIPADIRRRQVEAYICWQNEIRQLGHLSTADFVEALANDAIVIQRLLAGNLGDIDPLFFLSSTNYIVEVIPQFYQEFPGTLDLTFQRLDEHVHKKGILNWAERSYAKQTKKNIEKVKIKEE